MSGKQFAIRRQDGRSDAQVILDMVKDKDPGTKFSFDDIVSELQKGCTRIYKIDDARAAVSRSERRLLQEQSRSLMNIRGYGYKVAEASEHVLISRNRQDRSNVLLHKGLMTLQNVRWNEMDANQRTAHEAQLLVLSAVVHQQESIIRRQDAADEMIRKLIEKTS